MAVSANTLFHFTDKTKLLKILDSSYFFAKYSKEYFKKVIPDDSPFEISHIPMVSFCDLRLTQLSNPTISIHTKDFGEYGLGFYKTWGIQNKVSPVVYIHSNSRATQVLELLRRNLNNINKEEREKFKLDSLSELIKFLKPYDGHYQKGNWKKKLRRYYDEREWRFIPDENHFPVIPHNKEKKNEIKNQVNKLNNELENVPLHFEPKQIKYIIIKNDDDKSEVAMKIKSKRFEQEIETNLITKIVTLKQLEEDY